MLHRRHFLLGSPTLAACSALGGDNQSPEAFGARGDGEHDDTQALADWVVHQRQRGTSVLQLRPNAVYLTDELVIPNDMGCEGNGACIMRRRNRPFPLVLVGKRGFVRNLRVDGRMNVLGSSGGGLRMSGIVLDDDASAVDCESYQNARHNISNRNVLDQRRYRGIRIIRCRVRHGGADPAPDGSGKGDGINLTNVSGFLVQDCETFDNGRSDMVVTTFDPRNGQPDARLTTGGRIENLKAGGGAYVGAEVNFEHASAVSLVDSVLPRATVIFAHSDDVVIENVVCNAIYSEGGDRPRVLSSVINNDERSSDLLYLTGDDPVVRKVRVTSGALLRSGTAVTILPRNGGGQVHDLHVAGVNNGIRLDVDNFGGLSVVDAANVEIRVGAPGASTNVASSQLPYRRQGGAMLLEAD